MSEITFSRLLARHVLAKQDMSPELSTWMRLLLLDYYAVTAGGVTRESAAAARAAVRISPERSASFPAALHGADGFVTLEDAALVNGITAHGLELDDTFEESSLHPAVVLFPTALAAADAEGFSVNKVLSATAAGYDVMCSVGVLLGAAEAYGRGFHPTGVAGALGAAATAAALFNLDEDQTVQALGLAANMAAGSLEFLSDGAWTKRLNAGHAAATGLRAAKLAFAGFTAPETAMEGRDGFLRQYGEGLVEGRTLRLEFGQGAWETSIKFYPCCRYMHGNIDLLRDIHDENPGIALKDIESINVAVIQAGAALVSEPAERKLLIGTPVDAQFNMPFGAAVALATGRATVEQFDNAPALAIELRDWMEKVTCYTSERLETAYPTSWQAEVNVRMVDGTVIKKSEDAFRGAPEDRPTWADITAKAEGLLGAPAAAALATSVGNLQDSLPLSGQIAVPLSID
ncbi:MmgE/PrpD family protein [Arthrobacter sp. B6]|uniref:MmgE/PrpD family protein n=1 Tax=Arthrobacter sp. B6 TaxID=1570137 RepID=UPI000834B3DC|nr:MmgE/PrpD family protein [Arthrobacter sp. B6]